MAIAFVFPGQGSQDVGMGRELAATYKVAADVFAEVDEALGQKLSAIMWEGPKDADADGKRAAGAYGGVDRGDAGSRAGKGFFA